jgi:HNH endonuclease
MNPRPIRIEGDVAFVPLTKGAEAVIDAQDVDLVGPFNWFLRGRTSVSRGYAARNKRAVGRGTTFLHSDLLYPAQGEEVDHINGDTLDNRRRNLRIATRTGNVRNAPLRLDNTSGLKGVRWHPPSRKWCCTIVVNYKHVHLGLFDDKGLAAAIYDAAAVYYFGEFARTNEQLGTMT